MSEIGISLEGASLDRAQKLLAGIPDGLHKALKSAISRTTDAVRTHSSKAINSVYAISATNLRSNVNVKSTLKTSSDSVVGAISFSGTLIPLFRFDVSPKMPTKDRSRTERAVVAGYWRKVNPGMPASGHQLKSTARTRFDNAFIARMTSGHTGMFERTGGLTSSGGHAIREIMGSSYSQMLANTDVQEDITAKASETFDKRMDAEINRILNGY